jgi:hypothetical protein
MPRYSLSLLLLLALEMVPSHVVAQDYIAEYNRQRAYRQFMLSPSRLRTFSSYQSAQTMGYDSPLESGRFYLSPGYYHEQVSPYGREAYSIPQQLSGTVLVRPAVIYPPPVNIPAYPYAPYPR